MGATPGWNPSWSDEYDGWMDAADGWLNWDDRISDSQNYNDPVFGWFDDRRTRRIEVDDPRWAAEREAAAGGQYEDLPPASFWDWGNRAPGS